MLCTLCRLRTWQARAKIVLFRKHHNVHALKGARTEEKTCTIASLQSPGPTAVHISA